MTAQTIRNWIDQGVLAAMRVGRAFRIARADVDALLDRAKAESDFAGRPPGALVAGGVSVAAKVECDRRESVWDYDRDAGVLRKSED